VLKSFPVVRHKKKEWAKLHITDIDLTTTVECKNKQGLWFQSSLEIAGPFSH